MTETIQTFLAQAREAAVALGATETIDLIAAIQQHAGAARLRILIVGTPGGGRFSLANVLLNQPDLLPVSPIPRAPLPVQIGYGETTSIEMVRSNGMNAVLPAERLRAFLTSPDTDADSYQELRIRSGSNLLRTSELRIETIGARRPASAWKEILANTDFALLVLNATALLSEQERRFVRDTLQPEFGLERVAMIINQMDLVAEQEQSSIGELMRAFLGPFERQPLLIEFSAAQASAALAAGDSSAASGYDTLMHLVHEDLLGRHQALKAAAARQAAELCLAALESAVQRQQALLETSEAELQRLLDQLDPESDWLKSRTERTQHRLAAFISTLLKEQCLREMEAFSGILREQLPAEVMAVEKVAAIKHHLPGYIEALWSEFFSYLMPRLRNQLLDEMHQVGDLVASDLREMIGNQSAPLLEALSGFDPVPASMKAFVMPARGHHPAGTAATWMQVGGLAFLVMFPQMSLILIGVGQAVRLVFLRDIVAADKQAIIGSVIDATHDLERQLKRQVASHFDSLTGQLQQTVADMYMQGIASMRETLEEQIARHNEVVARREQVARLASSTIPELRQMLERLIGGKA